MRDYTIIKTKEPITSDSWQAAGVASINCFPWPAFTPSFKTEARLLYTDEALYVNLKSTETKLRAYHNERDASVCEDSCMEFFVGFDQKDPCYFNFEINPLGTLLLHLGTDRTHSSTLPDDEKIFDIKSIITQNGWELFYKIPFSFIMQYFENITDEIKGNFYKCGDLTVQEHYACWNRIESETPDYHRPEYFGTLRFEKGAPNCN